MSLINPRAVQNKSGVTFSPGNLTFVYAEDYKVFSDSLRSAGSEVYLWLYNVDTATRDTLTPQTGQIVFNSSIGSIQFYNGAAWSNIDTSSDGLPQGVLPVGSIPSLSGLYIPQGQLPSGSIPTLTAYIPQGVLPVGSIPSLTAYLPQGNVPVGSLSAVIPQGIIPYGSLVNSLPQGVLPVGSIPSLTSYIPQGAIPIGSLGSVLPQGILPTGSIPSLVSIYIPQGVLPTGSIPTLNYLPQGQLPTGSLPNNISISGSVTAGSYVGYGGLLSGIISGGGIGSVFGTTNRITVTSGSIVDIASTYVGQNTITTVGSITSGIWNTGLNAGSLTSGTLSQSVIPNLSGSYIPQGVIANGSLPTNISIGGSFVGSLIRSVGGSFTDSVDLGRRDLRNVRAVHMQDGQGSYSLNAIQSYTGDVNGMGLTIQGGGLTVIGGGDSATTSISNLSTSTEDMWVTSDVNVNFATALQGGWGSRYVTTYNNVGLWSFTNGSVTLYNGHGSFVGSVVATSFIGSHSGDGANLTNVPVIAHNHDGSAITTGTVSDSRLPTSMAGKTFTSNILGTNGSFTGSLIFNGGTVNNNLSLANNNLNSVNQITTVNTSNTGSITTASLIATSNGSFLGSTVVGSSYITNNANISYNAATQSLDFTIL